MQIESLSLPGCLKLKPKTVHDTRGEFVKPFVKEEFESLGLRTDFVEEYYSCSGAGVLRGLHFQIPPHEYYKAVICLDGCIRDVIVDLRAGSPMFGRCQTMELDARDPWLLYLPPGIAHGFLVLSESALILYKVTSYYAVEYDAGVLWSSIPVDWGIDNPLLSPRDAAFPSMEAFTTPFTYVPDKVSQ